VSRTSVFLSYARGDDEAFVGRVHAFLSKRGFDVWWDKPSMPARGLPFPEEIREAIHKCDRVVVVIGPRALRSDYVRAEWQASLSERKPVVTVLRRVPDGVTDPHSCLPPELRMFHAEPFLPIDGQEPPLDRLADLLSSQLPSPPRIFGRPPERPPHFRPRPDMFSEIFDAVLGETMKPEVHRHERRVTVLTGMGGIGKTVLATTLVEAMRARPTKFLDDGIHWLSGPPLRRLAARLHVTGIDPDDEESLVDEVAKALDGKRFLLVVDNATDVRQVAPLVRVLGPGGRMLVTTRHGELAVGHRHIAVDRLSEDEALGLVADWLRVPVEQVPGEARLVVKRCGFHPFAIALNAAAASQGLAWSRILTALEKNELDYATHGFEDYVYRTVEQSLRVSLDALSKRDRARYLELAAFFWEDGVPEQAILQFWQRHAGLPEHRGAALLVFFQQRSLLQVQGPIDRPLHLQGPIDRPLHRQGPIDRRDVRIHDLHGSYLARDARKVATLGNTLLDGYEQALPQQPGAWWRLPDDGYLHRHLVRHLMLSRSAGDALTLLSAENDRGRNAWYEARVHGARGGEDGLAGYVSDLEAVSRQSDDCLLVLIAASLRSLARTVPGDLLLAAIGDGRWSIERGITRARLIVEPEKRAHAMIALLPKSTDRDAVLDEALAAIEASDVRDRKDLLPALAPLLEEAELLPVLRRLASWAERAATPYEKHHTSLLLHAVLERVPAPLASEALQIADRFKQWPTYLYGLLPEPERTARVREALDEHRGGQEDIAVAMHASRLGVLARHRDPAAAAEAISETLARARALEPGGYERYAALEELLPILDPVEQMPVLDELLDYGREHLDLGRLAAMAPPQHHGKIREKLETQGLPLVATAGLALGGEHRRALVEHALGLIETHDGAAELLETPLLLAMDDSQRERAHRAIDVQLRGKPRVSALISLARASPAERRERMLDVVLLAIEALPQAGDRESAYADIAPLLSEAQVGKVLLAAERIGEPSGIAQIPRMLPHLSGTARAAAVALVVRHATSTHPTDWADALRVMPPGVDIEALGPMLDHARAPGTRRGRPDLLTVLATRVGKRERTRAMDEAREAIAGVTPVSYRIRLLLELGHIEAAEQALSQAATDLNGDTFAWLVALIVPRLPPGRGTGWVQRALNRGHDDKEVLETLAPVLDPATALNYLAAQIVPDDPRDYALRVRAMAALRKPVVLVGNRALTAAALAERLAAQGMADAAWDRVRVGRNDAVTAMALIALAPWLSRERLLDAERRVLSASFEGIMLPIEYGRRNGLIARLAPSLARAGQLERALDYAARADDHARIAAYLGIADATDGRARSDALLLALRALLTERSVILKARIDEVARAIARDPDAARSAWAEATAWARSRPRNEAIDGLAALAPVAAAVRGESLVDETFAAIERVVRWWP